MSAGTCEGCGCAGVLDEAGLCVACAVNAHVAALPLHPEVARVVRRCEGCGHYAVIVDDRGLCLGCVVAGIPTAAGYREPAHRWTCEECGALTTDGAYSSPERACLCARCHTRAQAPAPPRAPKAPARCEGCGSAGRLNEDGVCGACSSTAVYRVLDATARVIGWAGRHRR